MKLLYLGKLCGAMLFVLCLAQCKTPTPEKGGELSTSDTTSTYDINQDPFRSGMPSSQFFNINAQQDNVVEGNQGTIIVCPKGCFMNAQGQIVEDSVKIELIEVLSMSDAVLSNLTTTSDSTLLQTDGMIYYNATSKGQKLSINPNNPVYIQIPTKERLPDMMVYDGVRDKDGKINWIDPKPVDNFLIPYPLSGLDFLPEGFKNVVDTSMPYRHYKIATPELVDSLYYSLSSAKPEDYDFCLGYIIETPPYTKKDSIRFNIKPRPPYKPMNKIGIDPAIIKTIKTPLYENTLIATKEFETRLKTIFKTCNNKLLELYIKNIDKNLYEIDQMAAQIASETYKKAFNDFAQQKLTNVQNQNKYAILLNAYYAIQLTRIQSEIKANREKALKALETQHKINEQIRAEYRAIIQKRYIPHYSFPRQRLGWVNVDKPFTYKKTIPSTNTSPTTLPPQLELEFEIPNAQEYTRVQLYLLNHNTKTLCSFHKKDQTHFGILRRYALATNVISIAIGYKDLTPSAILMSVPTKINVVPLEPSSTETIKKKLSVYDNFRKEHNINIDLAYIEKLYKIASQEKVEREAMLKDCLFMSKLFKIAYPCTVWPLKPKNIQY